MWMCDPVFLQSKHDESQVRSQRQMELVLSQMELLASARSRMAQCVAYVMGNRTPSLPSAPTSLSTSVLMPLWLHACIVFGE